MRTTQMTPRASAFERSVTDCYQSFNCSEPRFLLESSLQSSHEPGFRDIHYLNLFFKSQARTLCDLGFTEVALAFN
ncbi:hypothetical protein Hanom_Chr14g01256271 [Helianthus anomalus]